MNSDRGDIVNNPELHEAPGILTIDSTTPQKIVEQNNRIPIQTIRLVGYRIEMNSAANALAQQMIYLDVPFLSSAQLTDGTAFFNYPFYLDNAIVTLQDKNVNVYLKEPIKEKFKMSLRNSDGTLVDGANLVHFSAQFEYRFTGN